MRLLPRSLFSRLVLVLLGGLLTAQPLSFAVHMHDRGELLAQASGMQSAQRIADIVHLLDSMTPAERGKILKVLSAPPLAVSLDRGPLAPADADSVSHGCFVGCSDFLGRFQVNHGFGHRFCHHFGRKCTPSYIQYELERGEKLNLTYVQGDVELFFSLKNKVHVFATGTISVTYLDSHRHDIYLRSKYEDIYIEYLNSGPSSGDIELNADDSVTLSGELYEGGTGQIMAGDDLCIRAGDDIQLLGNVSAGGEIDLWAEHNIETTGTIVAGDDIWIKTDHCGGAIAGSVQSGGRLDVSSGEDLIISAPLKAGGDLEL